MMDPPLIPTASSKRTALPTVSAFVVDDDDDARELLCMVIQRAGYSVLTARHGREALDLLQAFRPHVIIIDLSMPIMNGAEFRQAQRRDREWIKIPTVVMTGTTDEPQLDPAIEATLHKPVRAKDILEILGRHARRRS